MRGFVTGQLSMWSPLKTVSSVNKRVVRDVIARTRLIAYAPRAALVELENDVGTNDRN